MDPFDMGARRDARIQREAAQWIARLHADACSDADRSEFAAWRAQSARHWQAYENVRDVWQDMALVPAHAPTAPAPRRRTPGRRGVLTAGGALLAGGGGLLAWTVAAAETYETGIAQTRRVKLDGGATADLDALSRFSVPAFGPLTMQQGRVRFQTAGDPIAVEGGGYRLIAERASFDIECDGKHLTRIALIDGEAHLRGPAGFDSRLSAPCLFDGRSREISALSTDALDELTAWRNGRAVFRNEPLSEALATMNRYDERRLVFTDPRLAKLNISGMFSVGDNLRFAQTLEAFLPVQARAAGGEVVLASRPAGRETFTKSH